MLQLIANLAKNTWDLTAAMAPYLLFGFSIAGLLHLMIRKEKVQQLLGKRGLSGVIKAALIGVPMPLCSCSVIPVAASLRQHGASKGATASFLSSTPQTGIDSILATYVLMGSIFTTVRVIVAFITGLVAGLLVDLFSKSEKLPSKIGALSINPLKPIHPVASSHPYSPDFTQLKPLAPSQATAATTTVKGRTKAALRHGLITLPADLALSLLVGLALAGLITTLMPEHWLSGNLSSGWLAFVIATAISLPLYVCATASIPMAYALMAAGLSPGAALIFLIVGPATNTATVAAVWNMLGRKATLTYLSSLVVVSWLAGWIFNASSLGPQTTDLILHHHEANGPTVWQHSSAILLISLLVFACWQAKRPTQKSSCCS